MPGSVDEGNWRVLLSFGVGAHPYKGRTVMPAWIRALARVAEGTRVSHPSPSTEGTVLSWALRANRILKDHARLPGQDNGK